MTPTVWISFLAGLLSFFSPCVLPLYPSYLSYISGVSISQVEVGLLTRETQIRVLLHTLFFVFGLSVIFFSLGLSASWIGRLFFQYREIIRFVGGLVLIVMGLILAGIIAPNILIREWKWHYRRRRVHYLGSFLIGVSFASGWTPCVGPIFSSVLVLAATNEAAGILLITAYIAGFSIPFLVIAGTLGSRRILLSIVRYSAWVSRVSGYLLILMGILLASNAMQRISNWTISVLGIHS
ncbi:cytochrome c biogenesis CcdA family protein [Alicyclobacillus sendaiensis]|uniref:cytochrome c biogenesis CcdA family protein n=1 Tax=Alicyclobacillus sendaiensis TaxID=192387 RepID=UPI0009FB45BD|nr:cytochrome c biogenesis protein CcdA [Alicyclobacillus sendaiensis]